VWIDVGEAFVCNNIFVGDAQAAMAVSMRGSGATNRMFRGCNGPDGPGWSGRALFTAPGDWDNHYAGVGSSDPRVRADYNLSWRGNGCRYALRTSAAWCEVAVRTWGLPKLDAQENAPVGEDGSL
jgi:hypothetical protein